MLQLTGSETVNRLGPKVDVKEYRLLRAAKWRNMW